MASSHAPLALAAVAAAGMLVYAIWAERRRRAEVAELQAQLLGWRGQLLALKERVDMQHTQIAAVWSSQTVVFTVCQYNILASYLGDNKQPWFLYAAHSAAHVSTATCAHVAHAISTAHRAAASAATAAPG